MTARTEQFRAAYALGLRRHVADPGERTLRRAYDLGRDAVTSGLSVLDVSLVHHDCLISELQLGRSSGTAPVEQITRAAADFFLESLSAFEMIQRGFKEARDAASLERRQAAMVRQLSTLLADASLALDAFDSLEEMLRLVTEQARELTGAACSFATAAVGGELRTIHAASYSEADRPWSLVEPEVLARVYPLVRPGSGAATMTGEQHAHEWPYQDRAPDVNRRKPVRG